MSKIKLRWKNTFDGLSLLSFMCVYTKLIMLDGSEKPQYENHDENEVDRDYELFAKQNKSLQESV